MPDPTPAQPPAQPPDPKKAKRERGLVNKAHQEAVSKTDKVVSTAMKPAHAPKLAEREIDEAFITALRGRAKITSQESAARVEGLFVVRGFSRARMPCAAYGRG